MYLHGLNAFPAAVDAQAKLCIKNGGIPNFWYGKLHADGTPDTTSAVYMGCEYPPQSTQPVQVQQPTSNAPITVSVPTTVNTQVSPQVSPQFIQQEKPVNSGIDAQVSENAAPEWIQSLIDALSAKTAEPAPMMTTATAPEVTPESTATVASQNFTMPLLIGAGLLAALFLRKR